MKYILKKEYPGSPKLGTILTHEELQFCNWNEYYQEVIEKDYEILSFININTQSLVELHNNGKYCYTGAIDYKGQGESSLEYCLNHKSLKIHSVKRKDGEIFTIGDKVSNIYDKDITIINKFEFNHDTITINGNYARLSEINKSKKPLFTTEQRSEIEEIIKNIKK